MGGIGEIFLLAQETASGQKLPEPVRQKMLDGHVGRCDDILPRSLVVDFEPAGPVHQRAGLPDNVDDVLYADIHGLSFFQDAKLKRNRIFWQHGAQWETGLQKWTGKPIFVWMTH